MPYLFLFVMLSTSFGGSGNDAANSVAVDAQDSVYMAGTTTSFDLPVLNAYQPANRGTEIMVSPDAGLTWRPLNNLPPGVPRVAPAAPVIAASALDPKTVYAARDATIYRSVDGGVTFTGTALPLAQGDAIGTIAVTPDTVYAASTRAIFRSSDTGLTWLPATGPGGNIDTISIDPFNARNIWAWVGDGGFVSQDGANTWTRSSLPIPPHVGIMGGYRFIFDPAVRGVIYGPGVFTGSGQIGFQKSTDGGVTWNQVQAPFPGAAVAAWNGFVYGANNSMFYRSSDGGTTWQSFPLPGNALTGPPAIDPADPNVILCGPYRSQDGGQTWSAMTPSRTVQISFAAVGSSTVYGAATVSSDVFVAKYAADGVTPLLATYFGGMGNETAASIKVDWADNIWVFGTTTSIDLPVTPDAMQKTLTGSANLFIAKFDWSGALVYCSYLGSSGSDSAAAMSISPDGSVWIAGTAGGFDLPIAAPPPLGITGQAGFVARLDSSGSRMLFSTYLYSSSVGKAVFEQPAAIATDAFGSAIVVGQAYSGTTPYAFATKYHAAGDVVFSRTIGGTTPVLAASLSIPAQKAKGVDTDAAGNIYVAGSTAMTDFPVTANALQPSLHAGCAYPAFFSSNGFFSVIYYYYDDAFLVKLSPAGSSILYSTYLGGSCYDRVGSLAVTPGGVAILAGETDSQDFPVFNSLGIPPQSQGYTSFVSAIDTNASALSSSSYLSAGASPAVALAPDGSIWLAGTQGFLAQTQQTSGPYNPQTPATDAVLFNLGLPGSIPTAR